MIIEGWGCRIMEDVDQRFKTKIRTVQNYIDAVLEN